MIYDNSFHTVQCGYEDNKAVVDHIWNKLVTDNNTADNVVDQVDHGERV